METKQSLNNTLEYIDGKTYKLSSDKIQDGDLCYNKFAKEIDKCIKAFEDDTMCVEFKSGMRAVLGTEHYLRAVLQ